MSEFPSLPLFTDAFIADTGHLTAQETGAYLMLLMMAWRSPDCSLPDDDAKLARWARVDLRTWRRIKPEVMAFWTLSDGVWTHPLLSDQREIISKRAEVARRNGKHGGRPKSLKSHNTNNPAGYSWDISGFAKTPSSSSSSSSPSSFPPVTPLITTSPSPPSPPSDGGGRDDARVRARERPTDGLPRKSLISEEAIALASEVMEIAGVDPSFPPPGWCGAPLRVQAMLAEGWRREIILAACRRAMARKRDGPPDSIAYFERAIAREHAAQSAPLPTVEIVEQPTVKVHVERRRNAWVDARERILASLSAGSDGRVVELRPGSSDRDAELLASR